MAQTYKNIPVKPEVYTKIKMIADSNNRGLGDQVANWAERELPECNHVKQPVSIEVFNSGQLPASALRKGWYCPTCKRVYEFATDELRLAAHAAVAAETGA